MLGLRVTPYKLMDSVGKVNLSFSKSYIEIPWFTHIFIGEGIELMFDLEHRQPYCLSQHRLTMSHYQTLLESFKAITMYNCTCPVIQC